jgi:hypothetical protein
MNNYIDKYGLHHDAPVGSDGETSSGNALYYTAIAFRLGVIKELTPTMMRILVDCASERKRHVTSENSKGVPISRDEILGITSMGYAHLTLRPIDRFSWNFSPFMLKKFNLKLFIIQAFHCLNPYTGELLHRNTFWQKEFNQIYHVAFSVPLSDRYFINRCMGRIYNPIYHLIHVVSHWKQPENRSARLLRWFKTGKDIQAVANYFPKDHPFQDYV